MDGRTDGRVNSIAPWEGGGGNGDEGQGGIYPVSYRREVHSWRKAETESN